ncbi:sensor histidine kinase [Saccharothrix variisporea]|uniref:Two-component system sensor histidine kinase DesK n=1 Tax=Saccharothrix variisporea TaxID=543527 RepID=A0A495XJG1_9PSEU|nr:histidine kinase [Saccharothrix variisporea]RKT74661.1 two-component system sensor histidine kinase DesK [Saccharothrix variisporea]
MTAANARCLVVGVHVPMVAVPVWFTGFGVSGVPGRDPVLAVVLGVLLCALQLRHSLAAVDARRPAGWRWTLPAVLALAYLPLWWLGWWDVWSAAQLCAFSSVLMLTTGAVRVGALALLVLFAVGSEVVVRSPGSVSQAVYAVAYGLTTAAYPLVAYAAVRLGRVLTELEATRAELAEAAAGRERLRLSRDLHDLFGQSLSAISLKGDLALRLLPHDPDAARAEVAGATALARDTARRMRAISLDEHAVSLRAEVDGAVELLRTAGIGALVDVPDVPPAAEPVLAWAVREGVANVLRHSEATTCSLAVTRRAGVVRLEIVNDGVRGPEGSGHGLAGLAARAEALGGTVGAGRGGEEFRLVVDVPEEVR